MNGCWTIRRGWSLVHAGVAQTIRWMVRLSLVDVVVATHNHLSESILVSCLRIWRGIWIICLLCIIDIDPTSIFTVIILHLHLLKGIWVLWWLKKLLMTIYSRLSRGLVVVIVLGSSSWFSRLLRCSSRMVCRICPRLANHETVLWHPLH
jgi:hypothetical protein